jgi:hypothetical protein
VFAVNYQTRSALTLDGNGRPTVSVELHQQLGDKSKIERIDDLLLDTGADVTSLNKKVADMNMFPIIKHGAPVIFGFNDLVRTLKALVQAGKTEDEARAYLGSYAGRGRDLPDSLRKDFGITDIGLVCDLRKVSYITLCGFEIRDVIVATPREDSAVINEVLGMNVLEKFDLGYDLDNNWLYLSKRLSAVTRVKPEYVCGSVVLC